MKACRICGIVLRAATGLTLVWPVTSLAQDQGGTDFVAGYLRGLLQSTPTFEQTWGEMTDLISAECAAVSRSDVDGLAKQEQWLERITDATQRRYQQAIDEASRMISWATDPEAWATDELRIQSLAYAKSSLSDMRMELAVVALVKARVGECIETRRRSLEGEYWMTGTWQAKCNAAPGITPDTYGRISLQRTGGTIRGTVFPGADPVGAEVSGSLGSYGSFSVSTGGSKGQRVTVSGRLDSAYPLRGSGTIVLAGEVPEHGKWECVGTWKSD